MLKVSGVIAKTLNLSDLEHNQEASIPLYDAMELGGSGLGPVVDNLYTVADILKPLFSGYERVLVIAGLEEHYLLRLAHLVIERLHIHYPNTFIPKDSNIGALFTRLVPGLHPYPKMSKSIPASFIGIGEPKDEIVKKIINGSDKNEMVILEMIKQVMVAQNAFDSRRTNPSEWCLVKEEYLSYFLDLHQKWKASSQSDSQETSVPDKKW
jgi:tryptophanyl-tRNA synthetase